MDFVVSNKANKAFILIWTNFRSLTFILVPTLSGYWLAWPK